MRRTTKPKTNSSETPQGNWKPIVDINQGIGAEKK